ncbi:hypothetical protein KPL71_009348 [Citrus sinensis]|uniref:Uncharacterized protein n=1 Tax=Citrus sinensis TaxID=2711 RepID=A0ACB8MCQ3_CITSI|nr:hypothetical protein KPL71_009348 [Citrus sinensis]
MNALFCALDKKEFHIVSSCKSANEIWHKLEVVYEGTNQVKESKISRTAIEETKDLNVLPIDDLIGSLISYEEDLAAEKGHEEKKKNIALKASKRESDEESEMDDEELAMLARRFRKFYKKNNEQRKFRGYKNKKEKNESITCYECKKPGHIRPECPLLNKLKKKAMVATWDDSYEETSDDDDQQEMTNLALMAVGEESCDELDEVSVLPTYDELHDAFKDLHDELMKIDNLGKFDPKSDVGIFLGYSNSSKAYRVYNKRTLVVEESMHVTFDESNPSSTEKVVVDDNAEEEQQEEASNDNQEDAPRGIQEEHHEETNAEQNEARLESIRMLLAYACHKDFILYQMDVNSAFLNGYIMEEVYMKQPPGFENEKFPNHVYKLSKALYGLKQAPRAWYGRLKNFLLDNDFSMGKADTTLFIKHKNQDILIVQIYVDDIIFSSTNELLCKYFSSCISQEFEMNMMGELKYFLGLQIKQNEEGIFINQAKYVKDLLKRFGYDNGTAKTTPMSTTIKLDKNEKGKEVDIKTYRCMIGSLLYLTASRPDIMFSICLCARFQSCPKESHMLAVKRIFRYLIGTINLGLWYPRGTHIDLTCYSDADFAGYKVDRKSTSGTCHFLGHSLVSWFSKKQNSVALSTTEAEYIAAVIKTGKPNSLWKLAGTKPDFRFKTIRKTRFLEALETGQPVKETGKPNSLLLLSGPYPVYRILNLESRFRLSTLCPRTRFLDFLFPELTGKPFVEFHRNLFQLLGDVGWIDALLIEENVYPDLVKVFYSNMDCSAEKENRVITKVGGVLIEFDDSELNSILGSSDDGLDIFSLRKPPDIDDYVHVDVVRNICRRSDLSVEDCTIHFRTQCLCLQTHFLLRIIQSIVLPRSGHLDEVSHMDVAMIDCILRGRPVDLGYSIIYTMLSIPALITRSLPYGHFITRILKFFKVPILEPSCRPSKGIGDEVIVGLGFEWKDGTWVKYSDNKFTFLAPSDDRPLNAVIPADQLPVFSLSFRGQRRRRVSSMVASAPSASASVSSPPRPPISGDVTLQQLMDEVRTLSVRQTELQQEQQQQRQLQQQLIHGQLLIFEHFGIPYPFSPPSPPSSPPE